MEKPLRPAIEAASLKYQIDMGTIAALVMQESGGNPLAVRYEEGFFARYIETKYRSIVGRKILGGHWSKNCSIETEAHLRSISFGLCQIMGQVARERGFAGEFLTELLEPQVNLDIGIGFLRYCIALKKGDLRAALLRYNGGGDTAYPDRVLAHISNGTINRLI